MPTLSEAESSPQSLPDTRLSATPSSDAIATSHRLILSASRLLYSLSPRPAALTRLRHGFPLASAPDPAPLLAVSEETHWSTGLARRYAETRAGVRE